METGYITAFWYLVISAAVVPLMLGIGAILRPKLRKDRFNQTSYECGEVPVGSAWIKFNFRFYVVAIIFIIFDVEIATVFPTMTLYKEAAQSGHAGLVFAKVFLFVALLLVGLIYAWSRGDLEWVKGVSSGGKNQHG